jgi:hypothetical protein
LQQLALSRMATPMTSWAGILTDIDEVQVAIASNQAFPAERRSKLRYPLDLKVCFRCLTESSGFSGFGRTVNMSSGGVLVFSEHVALRGISAGAHLQMSIEWPSLLDGRIPLQLFAVGRILRVGASAFAATFDRYQFRTMRISSQPPDHVRGDVVGWRACTVAGA